MKLFPKMPYIYMYYSSFHDTQCICFHGNVLACYHQGVPGINKQGSQYISVTPSSS